jgi:RNA ligase
MYNNAPTIKEFEDAVEAGRISRSEHDDYVLFKYKKETVYVRDWDRITLYSRGIIFDKLTGQCVAIPFKKFFNLDETDCEMSHFPNDHNYEILEKMDGSMGCVFLTRDGELHVSTPGSFLSDQAKWATKWIKKHENYNKIRGKFLSGELRVLVAEIICPLSRVVVPYDFEGMVSIAAHDIDGNYLCHDRLSTLSNDIGFDVCRKFSFDTVDDVKVYLDSVEDFEGFVLHWPHTGYRVKMKGEDYCIKHRIISSIHPNRIDEAIDGSEDNANAVFDSIEATLVEFPEEFVEPYREAVDELKTRFDEVSKRIHLICSEAVYDVPWTAKELALHCQGHEDKFYKTYFSHIMNAWNKRKRDKKLIFLIWKAIREEHFKIEEEDEET